MTESARRGRHDVDDQVTVPPAAERSAKRDVFTGAQRPKSLRKRQGLRSLRQPVMRFPQLRCGSKQELDLHGLERKDNSTALRTIDDASFEQCRDVTVHRLDIAVDAPCRLADGDRSGTAQRLQQLPALRGEHFPQ